MKWIKKSFLVSLSAFIFCVGAYSMAEKITTSSGLVAENTAPSKDNPVGS
ncbi:hypothetical protein ACFQ49_12830 [Kroppenstedtia eburnea]|uniref:Uncharacterized protein n=2 Tax=Kroppenstedtia TaxID=1274351 RepID=A0A1N7LCG6_9BACL|nr:hypothetical protein [Kroppenstedtia eburnea]QKI81414.1 hypothetical protein GXN75_05045 [Kroppenstedtia eburnea]SIS71506.1 hypothetical protein SAMN05421790_10489 [Kroppenstedtia eburnea]